MASLPSDGSPAARGRASAHFSIRDDGDDKQETSTRQVSLVSSQHHFLAIVISYQFNITGIKTGPVQA